MFLLNALLTGGTFIGKICQSLLDATSHLHAESGISISKGISVSGVTFFRSNASGVTKTYAYNPSTDSKAFISIPNISGNGVYYVISPTEKVIFEDFLDQHIPADTEVITGLMDNQQEQVNNLKGGKSPSSFSVSFNDLTLGESVHIGGIEILLTNTNLIIITAGAIIFALVYLYMKSDKGIIAQDRNRSLPDGNLNSSLQNDQNKYSFDIDFKTLGFDVNKDKFQGQLTFEIGTSNANIDKGFLSLSKAQSEPLHPVEAAFLMNQL